MYFVIELLAVYYNVNLESRKVILDWPSNLVKNYYKHTNPISYVVLYTFINIYLVDKQV